MLFPISVRLFRYTVLVVRYNDLRILSVLFTASTLVCTSTMPFVTVVLYRDPLKFPDAFVMCLSPLRCGRQSSVVRVFYSLGNKKTSIV